MADDAVRLIHKAIDRSGDGDYAGALKLLDRAIKADPSNPQAHFERGMAMADSGRDREAVAGFERALELNPVFPGAREWLARILRGLGEHRRAGGEWLRYLRDAPDGPPGMGVSPQSWADCAEQFALAGDAARAVALLEEYLARHAARVTRYARFETAPLRLLARLAEQAGDPGRAAELRERARASPHRVPADGQRPDADTVTSPDPAGMFASWSSSPPPSPAGQVNGIVRRQEGVRMHDQGSIGCGFVQGFHLHTIVPSILDLRPQQRGEWLLPGEPPVNGQRVKVQVNTDADAWGILTGRITEIGEGFVVIGNAERTTDDDSIPCGPYRLTLRCDETMEFPWVLTHAELRA